MSSNHEHRVIRAALQLEAACTANDESAMGDMLVRLLQAVKALREEREGTASGESYVEREEER